MSHRTTTVTVVLDTALRERLERIKSHGVAITAIVGDGLERRVSNWEARLGLKTPEDRTNMPAVASSDGR